MRRGFHVQVVEKCKGCDEMLTLNDIVTNKNFMKDGKSICLTYYDCPKCGMRHFVQIDDETSLSMLDSVKKTFVKLAYRKKCGKKIKQKENTKFAEARANLGKYRIKLMEMYTGKTVYDEETGKEYVLRFFV